MCPGSPDTKNAGDIGRSARMRCFGRPIDSSMHLRSAAPRYLSISHSKGTPLDGQGEVSPCELYVLLGLLGDFSSVL